MWRCRKALGEEILLSVQCLDSNLAPVAPDSAPTMTVRDNAGTVVRSLAIPPLDRYGTTGMFAYMLPLNSAFATGRHFVQYSYVVSGTTCVEDPDVFEIVGGGDENGMKNAMFCDDRPDQRDFILTSTDMGTLAANRGPKI